MKSTLLKGANSLAISGAIVCLLMLTACGSRAGDQVEDKNAGAERTEGNAIPANSGSPTTSSLPTTEKPVSGTTQPRNENKPPVAGIPTTQIGNGGGDFFLFTQARAALEADVEFKAANIVIDVKDGLLTLSGTVPNAEQRSKAEQFVRAVDGVKGVKNQLRISIAKSRSPTGQPG